ncbi:low temperature requirement protein A [Streptomyces sp. NPDC048425]|uniref:low temperature requirement protein A n=1 Tax=Streptomyces sp. NPDC048425 TaxID=3365548 RepID=UPI003710AFAD
MPLLFPPPLPRHHGGPRCTSCAAAHRHLRSRDHAQASCFIYSYEGLVHAYVCAVGSGVVITHPHDDVSVTLALLFGGPVLYLVSQAWYYRATTHYAWSERIIGCLALAVAGAAAGWLPALASLALLDAILITLAAVLSRVHRRLAIALKTAAQKS